MRIKKEECVLLVVDYQERLMPAMYKREELIQNSVKLITGLQLLGVPVIVTQQYTKGLGMTVPEIQQAVSDFTYIDKTAFSCYGEEKVVEALKAAGKKTVIICGAETHVCVLQTVIDLKEAGYQPVFVEDCITSRKEADKVTGTKRAIAEGAVITSYESLLFELLEKAGGDTFKQISKLVK